MKHGILFAALLFCLGPSAYAEGPSLEDQLKSLNLPSNQAPLPMSSERLYAIQPRYVDITRKSEVYIGAGDNFNADSYISSSQLDVGYRYHFDSNWSVSADASMVFNSLSDAGNRLLSLTRMLPDAGYVKYRVAALASYNLFYGKFRLSQDTVFYFDQYLSLGPGWVLTGNGGSIAGVADLGFVFWMGRKFNVQFGVKDYYYDQHRILSSSTANDIVGHIDVGMLFGTPRVEAP